MAEAADAGPRAAEAATAWPQGRPLFAAHAELPWPDEPHLVLWHAQTLLREFRGDGPVAALVTAGIGGIEALLLHVGSGETTSASCGSAGAGGGRPGPRPPTGCARGVCSTPRAGSTDAGRALRGGSRRPPTGWPSRPTTRSGPTTASAWPSSPGR
jgi:hypothetical protein